VSAPEIVSKWLKAVKVVLLVTFSGWVSLLVAVSPRSL
jgi:hypothetical protein